MTNSYEETCRMAATEQGLDPAVEVLKAAGVDVVVEQTGGFCMVAKVYGPVDSWVGITAADFWQPSEEEDDAQPPSYLVCFYSDEEDEGTVVAEDATLDDLATLVRQAPNRENMLRVRAHQAAVGYHVAATCEVCNPSGKAYVAEKES